MTSEGHRLRHVELHKAFDELLACYVMHSSKIPSDITVLELMEWSYAQTLHDLRGQPDQGAE